MTSRRRLTRAALDDLAARGALTLAALRGLVDAEARDHGLALDWSALLAPCAGCTDADAVQQRATDRLAQAIDNARAGTNLLVDLVGAAQTLLWDAFGERLLPAAEERRYRQRVETAVPTCSAPSALPIAERLLALLRAEGSRHIHVAGMWLRGPGIFTSSAFMMARAVQTILAALYPKAVERPVSS